MDMRQVQLVRRFNRVVTQRVGALEDSYLRRGRPLGEARLIFETGTNGADVRALRNKLGLDSGYLSRLLRSLEAQGLILVEKQGEDGRRRRVSLTPNGHAELDTYDRLSDELAASLLAPLGAVQRDRLVAAMAEVERLIREAAVEVRMEAPTSVVARWCVGEYFRELTERFETGFDSTRSNPARDEEMTRRPAFSLWPGSMVVQSAAVRSNAATRLWVRLSGCGPPGLRAVKVSRAGCSKPSKPWRRRLA